MMSPTLNEIERALSEGRLFVQMSNRRYWEARRNGATQTWKTRPGEFRIPLKAGFKAYGSITHRDFIGSDEASNADFIIRN